MNKPFDAVLRDIRYGDSIDELSEKFGALVGAVTATQKAGEITYKIKLKPAGGDAIEVIDSISVKMPELPRGSSVFFATPENNLVRNDPRQPALDGLRDVSSQPAAQLKDIAA